MSLDRRIRKLSETVRRVKMCDRKIAYRTEGKAKKAVDQMQRKKKLPFKFYQCPECLKFHVAHKKPSKREES